MLLSQVHLASESGVGLPLAGGAGSALLKHLVDLLESETLGLRDEEEGEDEGDAAETAPHEEDVGAKAGGVGAVGNEVGGDDSDDAVPEPAVFVVSKYSSKFDLEIEFWGVKRTWRRWKDQHHANGWSRGRFHQ